MKRLLPLIGLFLLPLGAANAAGEGLYDRFKAQVEREMNASTQIDDDVLSFIREVYRPKWPMSQDEILGALRGQRWKACTSQDPSAMQNDATECDLALENIGVLAAEEQGLRSFGRTLQRIAVAQELPLSEIPGRPFHMATDLSGIVNIWHAGTEAAETASGETVRIRTLSEDETDDLEESLEEFVGDHPGGISDMALPGADEAVVWRYQYGVRFVRGDRAPTFPPPVEGDQSGPGTERQYVFKRWQAAEDDEYGMEDLLLEVWERLPKEFDPPLEENEVAYYLFPENIRAFFPAGTLLWARMDGGEEHPFGDVGLAWEFPTEPFLPSIVSIEEDHVGEPILGGGYPPNPTHEVESEDEEDPLDGRGLCSMTFAARGFLCRSFETTDEQACPDPDAGGGEEDITLVSCTLDDETTVTIAGADVCEDIEWRDSLEDSSPVCNPGETDTYKNTIGNNACYIGRCVEESLELRRATSGRSPATAGDGAFPFDDPRTGDALGTLLRSVPATIPQLPSYRPLTMVRILEDALCQLQGLPAATPPHLCAFSPSRRLDLPLGDRTQTARSLWFDAQAEQEVTLLTEQLAAALGSRIGTDIQGHYLRIGTRALSEVVDIANSLLKDALTVRFPITMCPLTL